METIRIEKMSIDNIFLSIVHISDTHEQHDEVIIPECDILIHSGDFTNLGYISSVRNFLNWLDNQPTIHKILIAGNHDLLFDGNHNLGKVDEVRKLLEEYPNITYLENSSCTIEGLKIYGSPYSPKFGYKWAFNVDRGTYSKNMWNKIPVDTNILITHGPPLDILDYVPNGSESEFNSTDYVGCKDLERVIRTKLQDLKLHCFGHIHDNYGVRIIKTGKRDIMYSNGSIVNNRYNVIVQKPLIINL